MSGRVVFNAHLGNIFQVYARSDRWDRADGLKAYDEYHQVLAKLANKYNVPETTAFAVFAAISPNTNYVSNLASAEKLIRAFVNGSGINEISIVAYGQNKEKAWRILAGAEPLDLIRAPKTRNFYLNLKDPSDRFPVTIDGHMFSVWNMNRTLMKKVPRLDTSGLYDVIAQDFRQCAQILGILPNQLQACCWFTWRRVYKIADGMPQPSLFELCQKTATHAADINANTQKTTPRDANTARNIAAKERERCDAPRLNF